MASSESSTLEALLEQARGVAQKHMAEIEAARVRDALTTDDEWNSAAVALDLSDKMADDIEDEALQEALRLGVDLDELEEERDAVAAAFDAQMAAKLQADLQRAEEDAERERTKQLDTDYKAASRLCEKIIKQEQALFKQEQADLKLAQKVAIAEEVENADGQRQLKSRAAALRERLGGIRRRVGVFKRRIELERHAEVSALKQTSH
jgi:hypothetical protein